MDELIDAGFAITDERVINNYVIEINDGGYVCGFYAVMDSDYDYTGQMADYPEACEGWYKFIPGSNKGEGEFVVDEVKKAEIEEERRKEALKPTDFERVEAQTVYTALMTDTLLPEEE